MTARVTWCDEPPGVTFPTGFRAAGISAGIKTAGRRDLALIVSETAAAAAGLFTTNRVQAAPVKVTRDRIRSGHARAVVVNSGNANACTGPQGLTDARAMCSEAALRLGVPEDAVLVCSTGTIGVSLPMDAVTRGIASAAAALSPEGGSYAAEAILTTDTRPKTAACEVTAPGGSYRIGAMAKGAGMIRPDMATMLAFLTTDARIGSGDLATALRAAADVSFHRITVDDDQSTNDTVLFLANGASGIDVRGSAATWDPFCEATAEVCRRLALEIVRDGEGATKFVTVKVAGAGSDADAERVARAVAGSMLVKSSWFGNDPNWGRVMHAVGYSGADLDESRIGISFGDVPVVSGGTATPAAGTAAAARAVSESEFVVTIDLGRGAGAYEVYSSDLSYEYVRINAEH